MDDFFPIIAFQSGNERSCCISMTLGSERRQCKYNWSSLRIQELPQNREAIYVVKPRISNQSIRPNTLPISLCWIFSIIQIIDPLTRSICYNRALGHTNKMWKSKPLDEVGEAAEQLSSMCISSSEEVKLTTCWLKRFRLITTAVLLDVIH